MKFRILDVGIDSESFSPSLSFGHLLILLNYLRVVIALVISNKLSELVHVLAILLRITKLSTDGVQWLEVLGKRPAERGVLQVSVIKMRGQFNAHAVFREQR